MGAYFSRTKKKRTKSLTHQSSNASHNDTVPPLPDTRHNTAQAWSPPITHSLMSKSRMSKSKRNSVIPSLDDHGTSTLRHTHSAMTDSSRYTNSMMMASASQNDIHLMSFHASLHAPHHQYAMLPNMHTRSQSTRTQKDAAGHKTSPAPHVHSIHALNNTHISANSLTGSSSSQPYTPSVYSHLNGQTAATPYTALPTPSMIQVRRQSSDTQTQGSSPTTAQLHQSQIEQIHQLAYQQAYHHIIQQQHMAMMQSPQQRPSMSSPSLMHMQHSSMSHQMPTTPFTPQQLYQYELSPDVSPRRLADIVESTNSVAASSIKRSLPQPPALQTHILQHHHSDVNDSVTVHKQSQMLDSVTYFHDTTSPLQQLLQQHQPPAQSPEPVVPPALLRPISRSENGTAEWKRGELLGSGAYGQVYLALHLVTGQLMAVKQVPLHTHSSRSNTAITALQHEINVMHTLRHDNIVQYIGTERTSSYLNIFLEYVPGGSISSLLKRFGKFNHTLVKIYSKQILAGLIYLHSNNIAHRDVKGGNILVDNCGVCKLADFGAATQLTELAADDPTSMHGTVQFMAPEVIKQQGAGRAADVWSLGCTVLEMLTGKAPWSQYTTHVSAMYHIANTEQLPDMPAELDAEARHFVTQCFHRDPNCRPTAAHMLLHPWLTNELMADSEWQAEHDAYVATRVKSTAQTPHCAPVTAAIDPPASASTVHILLPPTGHKFDKPTGVVTHHGEIRSMAELKRRSTSTRTVAVSQVRNSVQAEALFTVLTDQLSRTPSTDTVMANSVMDSSVRRYAKQLSSDEHAGVTFDVSVVAQEEEVNRYLTDQLRINVIEKHEPDSEFVSRLQEIYSRSGTPIKRRSFEPSYTSPLVHRRTLLLPAVAEARKEVIG